MPGRAPQGHECIMSERSMQRGLRADARIVITGIEAIEPALVGELTDDRSRVGPRIRHSLARNGQGWSAGDKFHADCGAR